MSSLQTVTKICTQILRWQNPFKPLRRVVRSSILFLFVFLLIVTQNYWLFITPVSAAPSSLLRVVNSFLVTSAVPGIASTLRIQINNDGSTPLTNLSFVNNLVSSPGALIIPASPAITSSCGGNVSFTAGSYPGTSGSITLAGGSLNNNSFCQIDVPVQGFVSGNYIQSIATNTVTSNTISNLDPTSATLQVKPSNPATIGIGFAPNTIPGDGRSRATISISNSNTYALSGAALSDSLPADLTVDTRTGAIAPTTTCTGGSVSILASKAGVSLTGATIPASGSCTITFDATSTVGGTYTSTILANALTTTNRITNTNPATANLNVQTQISIAKVFGAGSLVEENTTTATITITNGGNTLTNATLTDDLPSPLVIANTIATTTCTSTGASKTLAVTAGTNNSFSLNNANLAAQGVSAQIPGSNPSTNNLGTCTITVNVKAGAGSIGNLIGSPPSLTVTNNIPASALGNTEGRTNDTLAATDITITPALVATKSYSPSAIAINSTSQVSVKVKNNSTVTATGVGYTDSLPSGLVVATPPNLSASSCGTSPPSIASTATSVTLTGATINAGATCTVKFDVTTSSSVSTIFNNVILDNTIGNNQGFDSAGVTGTKGQIKVVERVVVSKVFTPSSVGRGLPSQLKITIVNNRYTDGGIAQPLTNVAITDVLPPNLEVANPTNFSNTCNGSITGATSGSISVSLSGGSILATKSCAITLDVIETDQSSATGGVLPRTYNNTPMAFSNFEGEPATLPTAQLTVKSPLFNSSKAFQSPKVAANGISTAVITLTNTLPIDLTKATFNDTWTQLNVTVANPPNSSTTCAGGSVTTTQGTRTVAIAGATVPRQINGTPGLCTVRFDVIMDGTGSSTFVNTIPASAIITAEGFTNPASINGTLTRVVTAVTLLKSLFPTSITVGQPSTLTVTVTNPASGIDLTNLGFVDNMASVSPGMVVYSVPNATTTCTGGTVSATPGSNLFTLAGASLIANANCTMTLQVTSSVTGNRTNTLPIGVITDREGVSNTSAASATFSVGPGLSVSKSFLPPNISTNGRSKLTIVVTNGSSSNLTAVNFTDPLPTNVVVANPPNATKTCTSGTLTPTAGDTSVVLSAATLANGASCTISVDVRSPVAGTFVNTIPVGNVTASGGLTNPLPITANLVVSNSANVLIVKRVTAINSTSFTSFVEDTGSTDDNNGGWPAGYLKGEISVGNARPKDIIEYTIYFLNVGLANARGVRICDRLSPNQTYISNSYNGLTPRDSASTSDLGMALAIGSSTPTAYLSTVNDPPDRGQYLAKPTAMPTSCNSGTAANANGIVVVDLNRSPDLPTLDKSTGTGTPATSYGYIRFRTTID